MDLTGYRWVGGNEFHAIVTRVYDIEYYNQGILYSALSIISDYDWLTVDDLIYDGPIIIFGDRSGMIAYYNGQWLDEAYKTIDIIGGADTSNAALIADLMRWGTLIPIPEPEWNLIDATKENACRTAEANAIRAKTGQSGSINYNFDGEKGFADAIASIPTGPEVVALSVTENGVYTAPSGQAYSPVTVEVEGGIDEVGAFLQAEPIVVINSEVSKIGSSAFVYCTALTTVSFPVCTTIGSSAFYSCPRLTTVSFPVCTTIGNSAFVYCTALTTVSFPVCTTIDSNAFASCSTLTTVSFPACTTIASNAFIQCIALTTVSFPVCTTIGSNVFNYCTALTAASFPVCTTIGSTEFASCSRLTTVSFPACTTIGGSAFVSCFALTTVSFPVCTTIDSNAFASCYNLLSLYLLGSTVPTLSNINVFNSTPISNYTTSTGGRNGSIIVQQSMLNAFKTATNWSVYSSRFSVWNGVD